ncbi:MAG TPA: hypothetical protein VKQ72_03540 [Aggregatilineales bacterium]|nr:hypothetical protein [Aggregatilineales bacterium]
MPDELSTTSDPSYAQDRSAEINAQPSPHPPQKADSAPTVQQASQRAMSELYRWFDTDDRFTRRLDAITAYIAALEAAPAPKTRNKRG